MLESQLKTGISYLKQAAFVRISFYIFCVSFLLARLPPFYMLVQNPLFSSVNIARLLMGVNFLYVLLFAFDSKEFSIIRTKKWFYLLALFIVTQALSVINAVNLGEFILSFKNIVFAFIFFINAIYFINSKGRIRKMIYLIFLSIMLNIAYQLLIYFNIGTSFISPLLYDKYWNGVSLNIERGKYFIDMYDFALLPFLLLISSNKRFDIRALSWLAIASLFFLAVVSNYRTHLMLIGICLLFAIPILFTKKTIKYLIAMSAIVVVVAIMVNLITSSSRSNTIMRIVDPEEMDYSTLTSRLSWWSEATDIGLSNPLFGIGLGNYYEYVSPFEKRKTLRASASEDQLTQLTRTHPHNIFFATLAETGVASVILLLAMLALLLYEDVVAYGKTGIRARMARISFWSLFSFALLNPSNTFPYLFLLLFLRAFIVKIDSYDTAEK